MKIISDIFYGDINEKKQLLDIYLPEDECKGTFLYFHGGGLEAGTRLDGKLLAEYLVPRGIAVVSAAYRMYPTAVYPDFVRDAATATAWVFKNAKEYGLSERIFVGGSSAGGYLSMMLCFDKRWLAPYGIKPEQVAGYVHDAGQPTMHFNVLREKGLDPRRVIIDDTCALYHIGTAEKYAPMQFIVSDNDLPGRYEQTKLTLTTLKCFGYDMSKVFLTEMHGNHCQYVGEVDEKGDSKLGKMVFEFIEKI